MLLLTKALSQWLKARSCLKNGDWGRRQTQETNAVRGNVSIEKLFWDEFLLA
jgi:hypothetical protein